MVYEGFKNNPENVFTAILTVEHADFNEDRVIMINVGRGLIDTNPVAKQRLQTRDICHIGTPEVGMHGTHFVVSQLFSISSNSDLQIEVMSYQIISSDNVNAMVFPSVQIYSFGKLCWIF